MKRIVCSVVMILIVIMLYSCGDVGGSEITNRLDEIDKEQKKLQAQLNEMWGKIEDNEVNLSLDILYLSMVIQVHETLRLSSTPVRIFGLSGFPFPPSLSKEAKELPIEGFVSLILKASEFHIYTHEAQEELLNDLWKIFESRIPPLKEVHPKAKVILKIFMQSESEQSELSDRLLGLISTKPRLYGTFIDGKFQKE